MDHEVTKVDIAVVVAAEISSVVVVAVMGVGDPQAGSGRIRVTDFADFDGGFFLRGWIFCNDTAFPVYSLVNADRTDGKITMFNDLMII